MRKVLLVSVIPMISVLAAGCGGSESPSSASPTASGASDAWLLTSEPDGAVAVKDAKASAKEGDTIVVRGRIGGRADPVSTSSPVFTIVDLSVPHCGENPEDGCRTPWDYCCEPAEILKAATATVQLVDGSGGASPIDPVAAGLKPLDEVIVVGTVGPRPSGEVLTIRATGVHRAG